MFKVHVALLTLSYGDIMHFSLGSTPVKMGGVENTESEIQNRIRKQKQKQIYYRAHAKNSFFKRKKIY